MCGQILKKIIRKISLKRNPILHRCIGLGYQFLFVTEISTKINLVNGYFPPQIDMLKRSFLFYNFRHVSAHFDQGCQMICKFINPNY